MADQRDRGSDYTAAAYNELRHTTAAPFNLARQQREEQYIRDQRALENAFLSDKAQIDANLREAFVDAGLNPDGSDPQRRPRPVGVLPDEGDD